MHECMDARQNACMHACTACMPTQDAFYKAFHGVEPSVVQPKGLNLW
jgi:hypothetical protein